MTVTGPVAPQDLGVVMPHEYCLVGEWILREAEYGMNTNLADLTFELKNLGKIQQFPYSVRKNLSLDSKEDAVSELELYRKAGGRTICDVAPKGLRYSPELLPDISRESGVTIVAGTAYYVDHFIPSEVRSMTVEQVVTNVLGYLMWTF